MNNSNFFKQFLKERPLSWSAISSFEYSPDQWYKRYILKQKSEETSAMKFGKLVGEKLASDPMFMPEVPRLPLFEYELRTEINDVPLIGFIDSFDKDKKMLIEYKTGKLWTKEKAEKHGQIDLYVAMLYLIHKIKPEELDIRIIWMETQEQGNFETGFAKNMKHVVFPIKKSMKDVTAILLRVKKIVKQMEEYLSTVDSEDI